MMNSDISGVSSFFVTLTTLAATTVTVAACNKWLKPNGPEGKLAFAGRAAVISAVALGATLGFGALGIAGAMALEAGIPIIFTAKVLFPAAVAVSVGAALKLSMAFKNDSLGVSLATGMVVIGSVAIVAGGLHNVLRS